MHPIIHPLLAMVLLTFVVACAMYLSRVSEIRRRRLPPQKMATRASSNGLLDDTRAADNYANLFELPILFYVGCVLILALGLDSTALVSLAWLFVISRWLHSFVHVTYNRVMHRFLVFVGGFLVLALFWVFIASELLRA